MSQVELVLKGFQQIGLAHTTEQIQQAQANINNLSNDLGFVLSIQAILQAPQVPGPYKKIAAVYAIKHARQVVVKKDQSRINVVCEQFMKIIQSNGIELDLKRHVAQAIESMLAADRQKIIRNAFSPNFLKLIGDCANITDENINFQYLALFGQVLMNSPGFSEEVIAFIQKSFIEILKITIRVQNQLQRALDSGNTQVVYKWICILRLYTYLLRLYVRRFMLMDSTTMKLLYSDQIQPMISKVLNLNLPSNSFQSSVFIVSPGKSSFILNKIKTDILIILSTIIKVLNSSVKEPGLLNINATFCQASNYLPILLTATTTFLGKYQLHSLPSQGTVKTLQEILNLMVILMRNNYFYQIFANSKTTIIQEILFKLISFNKRDMENYTDHPEQFINSVIHILERDTTKPNGKSSQQQLNNEEQEEEDTETLKTLGAQVLCQLCKYQDGTLSEVFKLCEMVLEGQLNTLFPKSLFLVVVAILRDYTKQRQDILTKLYLIITKAFQKADMPLKKNKASETIDYSMAMVVLSRYLVYFFKIDETVYDSSFSLVDVLLGQGGIEEVPLLISFQIIQTLNHLSHDEELQQNNSPKTLLILNQLLRKKQQMPTIKILDCLFSLIKYNDEQLVRNTNLIVDTVEVLVNTVKAQMEISTTNKLIINKSWNIIRQIGESSFFIPLLIPQIEQLILPLLTYLDTKIMEVDFEEDILLLMTSFIEKSKQVTKNQLKIFQYIPKIFYQRYKLTFGNCFPALNTFIFYGKDILGNAPIAINYIVQMCKTSVLTTKVLDKVLNEADNCEGVLLMQSLILSCGPVLTLEIWKELITILTQKFQEPITFHFLKSNIIATMALILLGAHRLFDQQLNQFIITKILQSIIFFSSAYSSRVLVVALSQLLAVNDAQFLKIKFPHILDVAVTILQMSGSRKENLFEDDVEDDEEKDYRNSLSLVINSVKNIDEFQYFKNKINWLRQHSPQMLQKAVIQLPQSKKDFLKNVLAIERIMDEPRQIFRVKRQ